MDLKQLKKLAALCRKAGIKHYKTAEFEFTLTEEAPVTYVKDRTASKASNPKPYEAQGAVDTDAPSPEDLLFWSTGGGMLPNQEPTEQ